MLSPFKTFKTHRKLKLLLTLSFLYLASFFSDLNESLPSSYAFPSDVMGAPTSKQRTTNNYNQNGINFLAPVSMELSAIELQSFLERYSQLYEFSYFIDRRVDPTTLVSGSYTDVAFISALSGILEEVDLSFCIVNNVFLYVGPQKAAGEALLLFYLKRKQLGEDYPRQVAEKLSSMIDFEIQPYSKPQDTFQALAKRSRLKFSGFDKTPFDLWRGSSFESVIVADLLMIMALGFNVDYSYDARLGAIKPTALDRTQKVMRYYPKEYAAQINKKNHPKCSFQETTLGNEPVICVTGIFEDVALVEYECSQNSLYELGEEAKPAHSTESTSQLTRGSKSNERLQGNSTQHIEVSGTVSNKTLNDLFIYLKNSGILCSLDPSMESLGVTLNSRITCKFNHSKIDDIARIIAAQINAKATVKDSTIIFSKK